MKIQTKLILSFVLGLTLVMIAAQAYQFRTVMGQFSTMAERTGKTAGDALRANAQNVYHAVERALADSLERGEMEKFDQLLKAQKLVPGLRYFILYDRKGEVFNASHEEARKLALPEDLKAALLSKPEEVIRESEGTLEIFQPQKVAPVCVRCHRDWQVGAVGGVTRFSFSTEAKTALDAEVARILGELRAESIVNSLVMVFGVMVILIPLAILFLRQNLFNRLERLGGQIQAIAMGDLSQRIPVPARLDEVSALAAHVNTMADNLAGTARSVGEQSAQVADGVARFARVRAQVTERVGQALGLMGEAMTVNERLVTEMEAMAGSVGRADENIVTITGSMDTLAGSINTIAAAAEEASQNVTTMASAAEQMGVNIADVNGNLEQVNRAVGQTARTIGQMTESLEEVRRLARAARERSTEASRFAQGTIAVMEKLTASAQEIGGVVELINNIADQTNMLALNASIEAAGAGSAGKGFAVVANEVKELARQTTEATTTINKKIEEIRRNTAEAATTTREITGLIGQISSSNEEISVAVDRETEATQEVSHSMEEVAQAAESVTRNANELESAARDVSRAAMEAAAGTIEIARSSADMAREASGVSRGSGEARELVHRALGATRNTTQATGMMRERLAEASRLSREMQQAVTGLGELEDSLRQSSDRLDAARKELDRVAHGQQP